MLPFWPCFRTNASLARPLAARGTPLRTGGEAKLKPSQDEVPKTGNSASPLLPTSKAPEERTWGARTEKNAGVSSRQNSDTKKIEVTLLSQNWLVVALMLHEPTRVAARATNRVGYAFTSEGVCQGLDRRPRGDFRRADDPDGLPDDQERKNRMRPRESERITKNPLPHPSLLSASPAPRHSMRTHRPSLVADRP